MVRQSYAARGGTQLNFFGMLLIVARLPGQTQRIPNRRTLAVKDDDGKLFMHITRTGLKLLHGIRERQSPSKALWQLHGSSCVLSALFKRYTL